MSGRVVQTRASPPSEHLPNQLRGHLHSTSSLLIHSGQQRQTHSSKTLQEEGLGGVGGAGGGYTVAGSIEQSSGGDESSKERRGSSLSSCAKD